MDEMNFAVHGTALPETHLCDTSLGLTEPASESEGQATPLEVRCHCLQMPPKGQSGFPLGPSSLPGVPMSEGHALKGDKYG